MSNVTNLAFRTPQSSAMEFCEMGVDLHELKAEEVNESLP